MRLFKFYFNPKIIIKKETEKKLGKVGAQKPII